jgi:hypothetical protein
MPTPATPPPPVIKRYYPTLASVVSLDDFPESLGFLKKAIENIFSKIHYKDLQYKKSPKGDAAFYSLSIVSNKIDIELFGSGINFVLNPDLSQSADFNISAFPVTVEYQWKILAYLRSFDLKNFSYTPQEFFELGLVILNISEEQALAQFINTFTVPINEYTLPLKQFIEDLKQHNNDPGIQSLDLTINENTKIIEVIQAINANTDKYATLYAFGAYLLTNDLNDTKKKLESFFNSFIPTDIESYIKDILLPKVRATLKLVAALEFPRKILQPVYDETGLNPFTGEVDTNKALSVIPADSQGNPRVLLSFAEALFYADTQRGFGYSMELVLNTPAPAQIGNTGLIFKIENLKLDLSQDTNIPEADADGRPTSFMGFYTDNLEIILPKKWFKKQGSEVQQTLKLYGRRLLIGSGGGISGTIGLEAIDTSNTIGENDYLKYELGENSGFKIGFNRFDITFKQNKVVNSNIRAMLEIPKLDQPIEIQGTLDSDFNTQIAA